jgi:DNA-binding transcriptional MerR regulator
VRISELSRVAGVPVPTIKYYLREKLLHPGTLTSTTQADYDDSHLERLRLVRALLGGGGLSVTRARAVLSQLDRPHDSTFDILGIAQQSVTRVPDESRDLTAARDLIRRWGWWIDPGDTASVAALAEALDGLDAAGFLLPEGALDQYASTMAEIATTEIANIPIESPDAAVRYVVLGTVLVEPLILALRRLAQQDASGRRFAGDPPAD